MLTFLNPNDLPIEIISFKKLFPTTKTIFGNSFNINTKHAKTKYWSLF